MISNEKLAPQDSLKSNGKSFYWASQFLGGRMGHNAARLYAFCRLLDDMADGDIPDGPARLEIIYADLTQNRSSDDPAFASFQPFMRDMNFSQDVLTALIEGLLQDSADEVCLTGEIDLLVYAYRVAGTVGLLMCEVLECADPTAKAYAVDLGIGMQLTNIARDVLEDAVMGRRYIPGEWVNDLSPDAICASAEEPDGPAAQQVRAAVKRLLELADKFYMSGARGYRFLPLRAHLGIAVAGRVYRQIGVQLAGRGYAWHEGRQVTSKLSKLRCSMIAFSSLPTRIMPHSGSHDQELHIHLRGLPHAS